MYVSGTAMLAVIETLAKAIAAVTTILLTCGSLFGQILTNFSQFGLNLITWISDRTVSPLELNGLYKRTKRALAARKTAVQQRLVARGRAATTLYFSPHPKKKNTYIKFQLKHRIINRENYGSTTVV